MENASKALIMAGSILIAVMTIGALMFMFDSISGVEQQKDQNAEIEATLEFNRQFEQYDSVGLRGSDLMTVINKMIDYNEKVKEDQQGYNYVVMDIEFVVNSDGKFKAGASNLKYLSNPDEATTGELNGWFTYTKGSNKMTSDELTLEEQTEFKRKYFKCTNLEYDNTSGRVSSMSFKEINVQ